MYAILLNNAHINFERTGEKNTRELQRVKDIEIEVHKNLEKMKNLNSDSCYDFSDYSDSTSRDCSITSFPKSETTLESFKKNTKISKTDDSKSLDTPSLITKTKKDYRVFLLKNLIKLFDILICLFSSIGIILSQVENEDFYNNNRNDRVAVVRLCAELNANDFNVSKIDLNSFNLSYINDDIIMSTIDFTNYKTIPIPMKISKKGKILRLIILITTLISVPLIALSNYFDFIREYIFKQNLDVMFFSTLNFPITIIQFIVLAPFPYPGITGYLLYMEMGNYICYPYSSMLSTMSFLRLFFLFKLFKHLTKWTSTKSEHVCEKYVCKADSKFAFKAFQKDNPFIMLVVTFVFSCLCFGLTIRTFERYYWENKLEKSQDWDYIWNCMWYIFVSMTTVGYGDMYACTQVGRVLAIFACLVGTYFVAMMMVFMTQITTLDENEKKAYGLINRLRIRKQLLEIRSKIVHSSLKMYKHQKKIKELKEDGQKKNEKAIRNNDLQYSLEKRKINNLVAKIKVYQKEIDSFGGVPIKELLFDVSERIDSQINEIKKELYELQTVNEIVLNYTNDLMNISRLLKKSLYATKLLYGIINRKKIFGKLNEVNQQLADVFDMQIDKAEFEDENENKADFFESNAFDNMSPREFQEKFDFILTKKKKNIKTVNSCKSINYMRACTQGTMKKDKNYIRYKKHKMRKFQRLTSKNVNHNRTITNATRDTSSNYK